MEGPIKNDTDDNRIEDVSEPTDGTNVDEDVVESTVCLHVIKIITFYT